jgi:hypothetical protein
VGRFLTFRHMLSFSNEGCFQRDAVYTC